MACQKLFIVLTALFVAQCLAIENCGPSCRNELHILIGSSQLKYESLMLRLKTEERTLNRQVIDATELLKFTPVENEITTVQNAIGKNEAGANEHTTNCITTARDDLKLVQGKEETARGKCNSMSAVQTGKQQIETYMEDLRQIKPNIGRSPRKCQDHASGVTTCVTQELEQLSALVNYSDLNIMTKYEELRYQLERQTKCVQTESDALKTEITTIGQSFETCLTSE